MIFSGYTHFSMELETAIMQKNYTAINVSALFARDYYNSQYSKFWAAIILMNSMVWDFMVKSICLDKEKYPALTGSCIFVFSAEKKGINLMLRYLRNALNLRTRKNVEMEIL